MIIRKAHTYTADVWSFGISLLELTNKHPPTAQNKIRVTLRIYGNNSFSLIGNVDECSWGD
jgi:serine/threonine protein kinase